MSNVWYYGGIEGGASSSNMVIIDSNGMVIGKSDGSGGTNPWLCGIEECCSRIVAMVKSAKEDAGIPLETPLECLGLSLSGVDNEENKTRIKETLFKMYPLASKVYHLCNDTVGSLETATGRGGVVLIAGTGSNCLLINPSGTSKNCGGWGHLLGDEGAAFWIAMKAVKIVYDDADGLNRSAYDTNWLHQRMREYFKMGDSFGILPHLYPPDGKFNKKHFANFCLEGVVVGARQGDDLCKHVLALAGEELGKHVRGLVPFMDESLLSDPLGLTILAVGSVWKSWEHLRESFVKSVESVAEDGRQLKNYTLVKLVPGTRASLGAAAWGARQAGLPLAFDYGKTTEVFCQVRCDSV